MLRAIRLFIVLILTVLPLFGVALADDGPAKPNLFAKPAITLDAADPIIASVDFNGITLEDAMAYLQEKCPQFKVAILRDEGLPGGFPSVTANLKGVSLSQLMQLIQTANPSIQLKEIDGPGGKIVCILVHAPAGPNPNGLFGSFPAGPISVVRVYRLSAIVGALTGAKNDPAARKDAMNQSLSLIKATLEQVGGEPPVLRVHEETQTLIFKGNPAQEAALRAVTEALQPQSPTPEQVNAEHLTRRYELERQQFDMRAQEMDQQMGRLQKMLEQRDMEMLARAAEREQLKVRLEMTEAKAKEVEQAFGVKASELEKTRAELKQHVLVEDRLHDLVVKKAELEDLLAKRSAEVAALRRQLEDTFKAAKDRSDGSK